MVIGVVSWVCHGCVGCQRWWVVARMHESIENPVNIGLQGLTSSQWGCVLPKGVPSQFVALGVVPAGMAQSCCQCEIKSKKQILEVPDPPELLPECFYVTQIEIGLLTQPVVTSLLWLRSQTCQHMPVLHCAAIMVELRAVIHCYIDRGCMCEPNSRKIIILCALQVEIINGCVNKYTSIYYLDL